MVQRLNGDPGIWGSIHTCCTSCAFFALDSTTSALDGFRRFVFKLKKKLIYLFHWEQVAFRGSPPIPPRFAGFVKVCLGKVSPRSGETFFFAFFRKGCSEENPVGDGTAFWGEGSKLPGSP